MYEPGIAYKFLEDLTINIGEHSEEYCINLENEIRKCAAEYCSGIDDDTLRFVLYSSKSAYFFALKTFEEALRRTLIGNEEE